MCAEGAIGLWQGLSVGSAALTGWALGSAVEGLASAVVVWRFTGARMLSGAAERRAQTFVAGSFWLLAKRRLGTRLGSAATAGEGTQNYLCAAQAAAVLAGLAVTAAWPGGWWADPAIGLVIAAATAWEGIKFWRGDDCC
jgi:hypothetical protein